MPTGGILQATLFTLGRREPVRQAALLTALAAAVEDDQTLQEGLLTLVRESPQPWSHQLQQLQTLLEQGLPLGTALSSMPGLLPPETVVAIRIAESSGVLSRCLASEARRLSEHPAQTDNRLFPVLCSAMGVTLLLSLLLTWMFYTRRLDLPLLLTDLNVETPWLTQVFFQSRRILLLGVVLFFLPLLGGSTLLIGLFIKARIVLLQTGQTAWADWWPRYQTPVILRLLALGVASGQSVAGCVEMIRTDIQLARTRRRLELTSDHLQNGVPAGEALQLAGLISPAEAGYLQTARESGHLHWGLQYVSDTIRQRHLRRLQRVQEVLPAVITFGMAALTLVVILAIYLPLISMARLDV